MKSWGGASSLTACTIIAHSQTDLSWLKLVLSAQYFEESLSLSFDGTSFHGNPPKESITPIEKLGCLQAGCTPHANCTLTLLGSSWY